MTAQIEISDGEDNLRVHPDWTKGNVTLLSSDGIIFRVESVIIERACPTLAQLARDQSEPLTMEEHSTVLDIVLHSIHPPLFPSSTFSTSDAESAISTLEVAIGILRATTRLKLPEGVLTIAATSFIDNYKAPLYTWSTARRLENDRARGIAVQRLIREGMGTPDGDLLGNDFPGMEQQIDSRSLLHLANIRAQARASAQARVDEFVKAAFCKEHRKLELLVRLRAAPFAKHRLLADDDTHKEMVHILRQCDPDNNCVTKVRRMGSGAVAKMQSDLNALLDEAVRAEMEGRPVRRIRRDSHV